MRDAQPFDAARLGYQPALDGLRAVAALFVVGFHAKVPGFGNGWIGVDVFFTLSGFLITSILLRDIQQVGRPRYRTFYVRRALRLLPAYVAAVLVAVVGDLFIDVGGTLKGAVFSAAYAANWAAAAGAGLGSLGHTWSLSIEEQFYVVWPALLTAVVWFCARRRWSVARFLVVLVVLTHAMTALLLAAGVSEALVWNATPSRSVQLIAGAALALGFGFVRKAVPDARLDLLGLAGLVGLVGYLALPPLDESTTIVWGWPAVALATCAVMASAITGPGTGSGTGSGLVCRLLSTRPLVMVGRVSYGLYLWHYVIFTTIDASVGLDGWRPVVLGLVLTAVVVPVSYVLVERPFLRRKVRVGS